MKPPLDFFSSVKALITLPSIRSPLLIEIPSYISLPVAPVFLIRSDPARSTKWNLAEMNSSAVTGSSASFSEGIVLTIFCSIVIVKIAWEREEPSFMRVADVTRWEMPWLRSFRQSVLFVTTSCFRPTTLIVPFFSSRIWIGLELCPVLLSMEPASNKS